MKSSGVAFENISVDNGVKIGLSDNAVLGVVGALTNLATNSTAQAQANAEIVKNSQATTQSIFSKHKETNIFYVAVGLIAIALLIRAFKRR